MVGQRVDISHVGLLPVDHLGLFPGQRHAIGRFQVWRKEKHTKHRDLGRSTCTGAAPHRQKEGSIETACWSACILQYANFMYVPLIYHADLIILRRKILDSGLLSAVAHFIVNMEP